MHLVINSSYQFALATYINMEIFYLLLLVSIAFVFIKNFLFKPHQQLPPGPNALHVLTYLSHLIHKPHIALQKLSQLYGPLISFKLGGQLLVVASSPDAAKEFLRVHDRVVSGRHLSTVYLNLPGTMHSSILLSPECGKSWKTLRSIAQNCVFSSRVAESSAVIRKEKVREVVDYLRIKEGQVVNVEELMFAALTNIISSVMTSTNLIDIRREGGNECREMIGLMNVVIEQAITYGLVDYLPILKWVDFWSKEKAIDIHRMIALTWGGIIRGRRSARRGGDGGGCLRDFLDVVVDDALFSDDQIGNALMEILIGATDSTLITSVWLVVELMRNQEMLTLVREEIAEAMQGDELSESLLSKCNYFQACIKETLRLHVPAPLLVPHRAIEPCKVHGYVIPRDSMVLVNAWAIARNPKFWDDATSFKPERFLDSNKVRYDETRFANLPFGSGLRMCPGSSVAIKNIQMLVASLLHYFDWKLPNGENPIEMDVTEKYVTTLKKEKPLLLISRSRECN